MTNYSIEIIDSIAKKVSPVIIEFRDNTVEVGYMTYDEFHVLTLYPLEASFARARLLLHRSQIKRIIHLGTGYVLPKEEDKSGKVIDIIEMNELINKADYEYI